MWFAGLGADGPCAVHHRQAHAGPAGRPTGFSREARRCWRCGRLAEGGSLVLRCTISRAAAGGGRHR